MNTPTRLSPTPRGKIERVQVDSSWTPITDGIVASLVGAVSTIFSYNMTVERVWRAITDLAEGNRFDPIKEWLRSLPPWDGEDRMPGVLTALKVEHSALDEAFVRTWFCGLAGRAFKPGTKFDGVLILVGREGGGKSTFFASLVPYDDWFTDSMSVKDLEDPTKAGMLAAGCLIVELAELSGMRKAEAENLKSAVTRTVDKFRPPYGRAYKTVPRYWVLGGTTTARSTFAIRVATGASGYQDRVAHDQPDRHSVGHREPRTTVGEALHYVTTSARSPGPADSLALAPAGAGRGGRDHHGLG